MGATVFLDRDGVINVDSNAYIKHEDEFTFIPQSPEAIALLTRHGFDVIVVTNQSVIGRGMVTPEGLDAIFRKLKKGVLEAGGSIKDIFFCPHSPDAGCSCRKPRPGLIFKARETYGIDLDTACMVGDSAKDIECAKAAGCAYGVLVLTGNGLSAVNVLKNKGIQPDHVAKNLMEAAVWIINTLPCSESI